MKAEAASAVIASEREATARGGRREWKAAERRLRQPNVSPAASPPIKAARTLKRNRRISSAAPNKVPAIGESAKT